MTKFFRDSKHTMSVVAMNELEGHSGSAVYGIHVSARRAKATMTAKRDEFIVAAFITEVHCTTERSVATVKHLINIFDDRVTRMQKINHFFIMVVKNLL